MAIQSTGSKASLLAIAVCIALVWCTRGQAADEAPRTWSDSTGKFKIKAKLVGVEGETVTLEKDDGSQLEIELEKLSPADKKFIADWQKSSADNPFKEKGTSPFKSKSKSAKSSKSSGGKAARKKSADDDDDEPAGASRTVKVNWAAARAILSSASSDQWAVPQPAEGALFAGKPRSTPLPNKTNFFEGLKGIAVSPAAKK